MKQKIEIYLYITENQFEWNLILLSHNTRPDTMSMQILTVLLPTPDPPHQRRLLERISWFMSKNTARTHRTQTEMLVTRDLFQFIPQPKSKQMPSHRNTTYMLQNAKVGDYYECLNTLKLKRQPCTSILLYPKIGPYMILILCHLSYATFPQNYPTQRNV